MADTQLLTPEQVADRLQVSVYTVLEYLRQGKLKGGKVGKQWRVPTIAVDAFLGEPIMQMYRKIQQRQALEHERNQRCRHCGGQIGPGEEWVRRVPLMDEDNEFVDVAETHYCDRCIILDPRRQQ